MRLAGLTLALLPAMAPSRLARVVPVAALPAVVPVGRVAKATMVALLAKVAMVAMAAVLVGLLVAGPAEAQGLCSAHAALDRGAADLLPGEVALFNLTVTADGQFGGDAAVQLSAPPGDWNATVVPASAPVPAGGASAPFAIQVRAPRDPNGTRSVALTATATLTCKVGGQAMGGPATASPQRITLTLVPQQTAAAESAPLAALPILLLAVVATGAGLAALLLSRARGPLRLTSPEPRRDTPPGGGASFPLRLENTGPRKLQVTLSVADLPEGWRVLLPPGEVSLASGDAKNLQVLLRAPPEVKPRASVRLQVEARAAGETRPARVTLQAFVVSENTGAREVSGDAPPSEDERPDIIVRDEGR